MANIKIEGIQYSNLENALTNGITRIGSSKIGDPTNKITRLEEGDIPAKVVNAVPFRRIYNPVV